MKKYYYLLFIVLFFACKKQNTEPENNLQTETTFFSKWLVINEGLWHYNNASITVIDDQKNFVLQDQFLNINNRRLGDIANDGFVYGSKVYIIVSESNTLEVLEKKSLKSIKQVSLIDSIGQPFLPRNGLGFDGKIWVSCFKGSVIALDTTSFSLIHDIKVGRNPEGLVVFHNQIVVTNSGGLDYPIYDSTISFIDPFLAKETKKVKVGINPGGIYTSNDILYVNCRGNYDNIPSKIVSLDVEGHIISTLPINPTLISISNSKLLGLSSDSDGFNTSVIVYDLLQNSILLQQKLSDVETPSFVQWIDDTQFWIGDAKSYQSSGFISKYETSGKLVHKYAVGMIPNECLLLN